MNCYITYTSNESKFYLNYDNGNSDNWYFNQYEHYKIFYNLSVARKSIFVINLYYRSLEYSQLPNIKVNIIR